MTSVQAELSSARLFDESKNPSATQDSDLSDLCASTSFEEISARIGGRFTADLAAILRSSSKPLGEKQLVPGRDRPERNTYANQEFGLHTGKIQQAVTLIQRHAPEQIDWLNQQSKGSRGHVRVDSKAPKLTNEYTFLSRIAVVPELVKIDTEVGRIARVLGQFGLFRAWVYGLGAGKGDGWINRKEAYNVRAGVEGTISQAAHVLGARRSRYRGIDKTHLQHLAIAAAINLLRIANWLNEVPHSKTPSSHFARLAA